MKVRKIRLKDRTKVASLGDLKSILGDANPKTSGQRARDALAWIIAPLSVEEFFKRHFEVPAPPMNTSPCLFLSFCVIK
jgi:hypothetical protein